MNNFLKTALDKIGYQAPIYTTPKGIIDYISFNSIIANPPFKTDAK